MKGRKGAPMPNYYHVFVQPGEDYSIEDIETMMGISTHDWYRYTATNWIVKSKVVSRELKDRLKPFVEPDGNLLILKINPNIRQGWMNKALWTWFKQATAEDER